MKAVKRNLAKRVLSVSEFARISGKDPKSVRRAIASGRVKAKKVDDVYQIGRGELNGFIGPRRGRPFAG